MPTFHHVNLGVPPDSTDAEGNFLVDILGYRRVPDEEAPAGIPARWFRADDGSEVHLSADPDHRPAAMAHVAVHFGPQLAEVEHRLSRAGVEHQSFELPGLPRVVFCQDPAGNRWELRGEMPAPSGGC